MARTPTSSTSSFDSIFNAALDAYKARTKHDLTSHPLLPRLQTCDSPDAIITIIREQIPAFSSNDRVTKLLIPTISVLYAFSTAIGQGIGLFPPANVIFAGIGVLLSAAKDGSANQLTVVNLFSRIEYFFKRLEIYTAVPPTSVMTSIIVEIMIEVISFLAIATKEIKQGRTKTYFKKLIGNTKFTDSLERLDKLTQEEARMASAELLKVSHRIDGKVVGVDDRVQGVDERVEGVDRKVEDVGVKVHGFSKEVQSVGDKVEEVYDNVLGVDDKLFVTMCKASVPRCNASIIRFEMSTEKEPPTR
ncbi:hypothetical protein BJV74DRAFT_533890 [Russula compacta]|nr:hypothetical protein BJV74DRAFT_533890 [Russula compacta]